MPAYNTRPAIGMYPGDKEVVWNAEASTAITQSQQLYLSNDIGTGNTECLVELQFSADPGVFEIDVQFAGTDTANDYIKASLGGAITAVNSSFYATYKFAPPPASFVRLAKISVTNAVNVTGSITR